MIKYANTLLDSGFAVKMSVKQDDYAYSGHPQVKLKLTVYTHNQEDMPAWDISRYLPNTCHCCLENTYTIIVDDLSKHTCSACKRSYYLCSACKWHEFTEKYTKEDPDNSVDFATNTICSKECYNVLGLVPSKDFE
jgi:hypothetical protein